MNWHYSITAVVGQRLLMRVVLLFDQQLLTLAEMTWCCPDQEGTVRIELSVCCEEGLARRLQAKLFHLQDVMDVELRRVSETPPASEDFVF